MHKQGDILLIPIPFSDLTTNKKRPVLVLSNTKYNSKTSDIVVTAITSNIEDKEYSVLVTQNDLSDGELLVDSLIRVDKIYTLSKNIVLKKFGHVKIEKIIEVKKKLNDLFNGE